MQKTVQPILVLFFFKMMGIGAYGKCLIFGGIVEILLNFISYFY